MAANMASLVLAVLAFTLTAAARAAPVTPSTIPPNFVAAINTSNFDAQATIDPNQPEYYPVQHFGPPPAPTTCFAEGPGALHVSTAVTRGYSSLLNADLARAWMNILALVFCNKLADAHSDKDLNYFDSYSKNTFTGYWLPASDKKSTGVLSKAGGWFSDYPYAALLQIGINPDKIDALYLGKDDCDTAGFDGKHGGQLMLEQDAFWGTDELYYTLDPNYMGHPANEYYSSINETWDLTKAATYMALHQCGSSC
ncbi:hypothetical protein LTR53_006663 [Teratosphaeriaceae sp. CCFEE 6253]|nr:hypothetical protein LTR53_006663 [Teratosphaeriaceae sp. CCFEE 6253]